MSWNKRDRQRIIDEYLNASGRNAFVPREFLEWLRDQPDNPAYGLFYGIDDERAAQAYREQMVRHWVSGLRITVRTESRSVDVGEVTISEYSLPAMISSVAGRRSGGGYQPTDPSDSQTLAELRRQAGAALDSWLERHGGTARMSGADVEPIKEIAAFLSGGVAQSAA